MGMNPPKRDAWNPPRRWHHVWLRFDRTNLRPHPGIVLDWRKLGSKSAGTERWEAWVVYVDEHGPKPEVKQGWVDQKFIRPAESDCNVWNDGPWR